MKAAPDPPPLIALDGDAPRACSAARKASGELTPRQGWNWSAAMTLRHAVGPRTIPRTVVTMNLVPGLGEWATAPIIGQGGMWQGLTRTPERSTLSDLARHDEHVIHSALGRSWELGDETAPLQVAPGSSASSGTQPELADQVTAGPPPCGTGPGAQRITVKTDSALSRVLTSAGVSLRRGRAASRRRPPAQSEPLRSSATALAVPIRAWWRCRLLLGCGRWPLTDS